VFSCKDRARLLSEPIRAELFPYIHGLLANKGCALLKGGGVDDHVHLLIRVPPRLALSDVIRDIKANSSRWIREHFRVASFAWQTGFGLFTVHQSLIETTRQYIDNQAEHHRTTGFEEELRKFLLAHGIGPDMPPPVGAP
jgi:REP element-mobilizing transposase RayT